MKVNLVYCLVSSCINCAPELKIDENYVHAVCRTLEECEDFKHHYELAFADISVKIVESKDQRFLDFFNK